MPRFNQDWHEVPAGTEVHIVNVCDNRWYGRPDEKIYVLVRADGRPLPQPGGPTYAPIRVAAEFISA